jgi:hypothetical protein
MYNQPLLATLSVMHSVRIKQGDRTELPVAVLSTYFLQLQALLDYEKCPALIISARSGCILSINLPAFEYLAMDAVGLSLLDFVWVQDAYPQIIQCSWKKRRTQLTNILYNADGQRLPCKVDVSVAPCYSGWLIVRFIANQA